MFDHFQQMIIHFIANHVVATAIVIVVFFWSLSRGSFQWVKTLVFIVLSVVIIVASIVKMFESWQGNLVAGLSYDAKVAELKYLQCLKANIEKYNLGPALKRRCPKGIDERCLTDVLNEEHPDVVAACIQQEHEVGFLANLWKGLRCLVPILCMDS